MRGRARQSRIITSVLYHSFGISATSEYTRTHPPSHARSVLTLVPGRVLVVYIVYHSKSQSTVYNHPPNADRQYSTANVQNAGSFGAM